MPPWREDLLHASRRAGSQDQVFGYVRARVQALGFEHCAYGLRCPLPVTRPAVRMLNTYPPEWQSRYRERDYLSLDPLVTHGINSLMPVVWTDELFSHCRTLREEACAQGLIHGWSQSCHGEKGAVGMLSVCRAHGPLVAKELAEVEPQLVWLTQYIHLGMSSRLMAEEMPQPMLTEREIEVLRWTAEGKTADEVAVILELAVRTVNFHLHHASRKLGACNKTAAVCRAATLGLLT